MKIEKIVAPCDLSSKEPYGTEWHADLESGKQIWIQTNKDIDNPKWVRLGNLFEEYYDYEKGSGLRSLLNGILLINERIQMDLR